MPSKVYYIETSDTDSTKFVSKKLEMLIDKSGILNFIEKDDFTGVKLHFGEEGNRGYIRHEWVKEIIRHINRLTKNVFLTDSNVLYKSSRRTNSVDHLKIACEHGFSLENIGAPILIADGIFGRSFVEIPISKKHFKKAKIASDIASCNSLLTLTHVTGHFQTGLGGAIKNLGMGCASRRGKYEQHSGVVPEVNTDFCIGCGHCILHCPASCIIMEKDKARISESLCIGCGECVIVCRTKALDIKWSETLENLQEKMVEYAYGVTEAVKRKIGFISFLIKVTKDCDCIAKTEEKIVKDLGILASRDPVSIDKASVDIMNEHSDEDILKKYHPQTKWTVQLRYAAEIGLGNLDYKLEKIKYE